MADGYISQIKTPDNKTYLLRDSEKTDEKVSQASNSENKEFPIILKNTNNTTNETAGVKYAGGVTVNPSDKTVTATEFIGNIKANRVKPTIIKEWNDTSFYGANISGQDVHDLSTFWMLSVKPDSWYEPWVVRFKITTTCPAAANYYSVTYCMYSGRADGIVVFNWNERYDHAHYYTNIRTLKRAGFDAGLGHAIGINLYASNNYTNANYYRSFKLEYYDCDNCTVTILDNPIKWANWPDGTTTNYNGNNNANAVDRGLQESGDANSYDLLQMSNNYVINGSFRFPGISLFGYDREGHAQPFSLYQSGYTSYTASISNKATRLYNTNGIDWTRGIHYNSSGGSWAENANMNISIRLAQSAIDLRYTDNCVSTASTTLSMVSRKPVYIRGTLDDNGLFHVAPLDVTYNNATYCRTWTQDIPTEVDNYVYWFVGYPYYTSAYQVNLYVENPLYWFHNGRFEEYRPASTIAWADITGKPSTATSWPNWGQIQQSGANNIEEGSSDVTANTEILTSYASNNGFADTNGLGKVYRRDASKVVNATLVKAALGTNATHNNTFLRKDGTWATALVAHQTYTAFTGNPTGNQTPGFGSTFTIQQISQSTTGQVSGTDRTVTIPSTAASTTTAGLVNTDAQTFAGVKTFDNGIHIYGTISTQGTGSTAGTMYPGGAYHSGHNSIVLHGDTSGVSGIGFTSEKATKSGTTTNINSSSDRAFIQYHAYGVTPAAEGTAPTLATSGESGVLVLGVGNDATDTIRLQAPGTAGILHQIGATAYPIPHTTNTNGSVGGTTTPIYVEAGVIKAGTALGGAAYKAENYYALSDHNHDSTYSYIHLTNYDFTDTQPLSKYVTFDKSRPTGAPKEEWYNGFISSHSNYHASYIINGHTNQSEWYVGHGIWRETNTPHATAPTWYLLAHSGNVGTGDNNGQVKIAGENVSVKGLKALAYKDSLSTSDIPNLSWNKITSDKPTTISGYGITDAKITSGTITLGSNTISPITEINWDSTNKKLTRTINGAAADVVTAATLRTDLGLSNALHFIGVTSTTLADGSTTNTLAEKSTGSLTKTTDFVDGDVVMDGDQLREYVWSGSAWRLLGITTSTTYTQPTSTATNTWIAQVSQGTDGKITATTGSLNTSGTWSGKATTSGTADKIKDLTTTDKASSSNDWRRVWITYANKVEGRPAYTDDLVYQTSTNTLKTPHLLIEHVSGGQAEMHITYSTTIDYWWGVGTANENHGLYDVKAGKWILSAGSTNSWNFVGNADTATNATNHIARTDNPHNVTATQLGLGNVENTKLSTWAGSTNLTTLGTITTGTWNGTAIANNKLANSSLTVGNKTISLGETGKLKEIQASPQYHVGDTSSCTYVLVTINKETSWMLSFTLRLYQGYQATDIQISGYNYGGNHWYSPAAVILGSTSTAKFNVYFGYTGNYKLWVAVDGSSYTGASVVDITNGYTQIDFENAITLTKVSALPETLQVTKEIYRPWYRNETVTNATNASAATTATNLANNPSIQTSGTTQVTITAGGKTSSAYTIPYATSAGSATNATTATYIKCTDTRNATLNPTDLTAAQGIRFDFKAKGTINLTATDAYAGVMSFRPYASNTDWSGGNAHQLAFNSEGLHWRNGGASWGNWYQILDSSNTSAANTNGAVISVARDTDTKIATINGVDIKIKIPASDNSWRPIGTGANDAMAGNTNVNNVTQTVTSSSYSNWRPLLVGDSNGAADTFTVTTKTGATYGVHSIKVQPSSGTIKATTFQGNLTGNVTGDASTVGGHTVEADVPSNAVFTDTTYTFDGTYNASSNKAATVSTVTNAINALDGGTIGTGSTTKTITSLSQTNGNVSATFSNIAFPVSSVAGLSGAITANNLTEALGLSKALRFVGITTTDMTGGTATNHTYTGIPAGISDYTPIVGDVVINSTKQDEWVCTAVSGTTYTWERLGSDTSYKIVQSAVSDPTAASTTSTTFIDTISQDANGVISATKNTLPTASTSVAGIIKIGTGSTNAMAGNTNVTNVAFTAATDNNEYPILLKNSTGSTTTAASAKFANTTNKMTTINPSTGIITAQGLKIASNAAAAHLVFSRTGWNYITMPNNDSSVISIGYGTPADNTTQRLVIYKTGTVRPGTNGSQNLGDNEHKWNSVYGVNFYGTFNGTSTYSQGLAKWTIDNSNLNDLVSNGALRYSWEGGGNNITSKPTDVNAFGIIAMKTATNWTGQLLMSTDTEPGLYWRTNLTTETPTYGSWTPLASGNGGVYYGTCSTAANVAEKAVICKHYHTLKAGDIIVVTFTNANTEAQPKLNVNSTGAVYVKMAYSGGIVDLGSTTQLSYTCTFIYDGTYWLIINQQNTIQLATASSQTNWRSILLSNSNSGDENFTPSANTLGRTYAAHNVKYQPSTGTLRAPIMKTPKVQIEYNHVNKAHIEWNDTDSSIDFIFD